MRALFILMLAALMVSHGCNTAKKGTKDKTVKNAKEIKRNWEALNVLDFPFESISYKSRMEIESPQLNIGVKMISHLIKDSVLWLSVSKFGFESHKVWLTKDSVTILDRLNSQAMIGSTKEWLASQGMELGFNDLQRLWIGRHPWYPTQVVDPEVVEDSYQIQWTDQNLITEYLFLLGNNQLKQMKVTDESESTLYIDQSVFTEFENQLIPLERLYRVESSDQYKLQLSIQDVKLNESKSLSFKIPEKYERISL